MKIRDIILLSVCAVSLGACSRVAPGNVGIQVTSWGSNAGVDPDPKGIGTYFTGLGTSIYEYPVSTHTYVWTASSNEGKNVNEEFQFNDSNGMSATADIGVAYHVDPSKAPKLYTNYRMDMDDIIAGPLRNEIRGALINQASAMSIEDIYGAKKGELLARTQADVQKFFNDRGLVVEQLYWAGGPRVPQAVMAQINQKITNQQQALAAEANVATAKADAEARVAKATGDAKATQIEAQALEANPNILKQKYLEKWDGHLPTYVAGNASNMIQLPSN